MRRICIFVILVVLASPIFCQPVLQKIGTYKCGKQPKQVIFTPDNKQIILPLLDEDGFDIFDIEQKKIIKRINPPQSKKVGFAEGLFIPQKNAFFVSQMTTAKIYEYSYPGFVYRREISTGGEWSKFIAYSPQKNLIAVSNWISNDVSFIDYATGKLLGLCATSAAPRGLAFIEDGRELISLAFDGGVIEKIDTQTRTIVKSLSKPKAAMRHIVTDSTSTWAYISDMYNRSIYKLNLKTFEITSSVKVFNNPNTIELLDDSYLFVSSRGPNNTEDYTKRSPQNGKIQLISTADMTITLEFEGGNQPTGLDISSDGKLLCFSNFQDNTIELYSITP
ncbi:MAG: YVTN family beta-propeller repeat-containing protein [Treponema sp.]|nr:YVTN family beta-propeller repeat-containing protein [Treponema sp.]